MRGRAVSSLYGGEMQFFVTAYVTCYCPLALSFSKSAVSHARRAPSRLLAVANKLKFDLRRTLFSKSHIYHSYGVIVLCVLSSGAECIF